MHATRKDAWVTTPERDLTPVEAAVLRHLLGREAPQHIGEVDTLKVVGQCSCGGCPTVIFQSPGVRRTSTELALYAGRNTAGVTIGIAVTLADDKLFELEGWSLDGQEPITWPELETLRPI